MALLSMGGASVRLGDSRGRVGEERGRREEAAARVVPLAEAGVAADSTVSILR